MFLTVVIGDLVADASAATGTAGSVEGRVDAATHVVLRAFNVLDDVVADYRGQRVHAHARAVVAFNRARDRIQQACKRNN